MNFMKSYIAWLWQRDLSYTGRFRETGQVGQSIKPSTIGLTFAVLKRGFP
jgi:hypothetical protein